MKKVTWLLPALTAILLAPFQQIATAQDNNIKPKRDFKNTISLNITNPIIFGSRSMILSFERITSNRQSFTISGGTASFPSMGIIKTDSLKLNSILNENGYNISADYRFYLSKENKYPAPRGVYIGPYYSFNNFENKPTWLFTDSFGVTSNVNSELRLNVHTIGFELGYQFVFWDRVALDMILLGPGYAWYDLKATIASNLSDADKEKFYEKLNDALAEKFPGYANIIDDGEFKNTGSTKTTNLGYRYMVKIGFRF